MPSSLTATAPGAHELAELRELLPLLRERDGADGIHPRLPRPLRLAHDEADGRLVVGHRIGVRHRAHRAEAAGGGGHRAGGHRLQILLARLPQVHVEVDEAGGHHLPGRVEHVGAVGPAEILAQRLDLAVLQEEVGHLVGVARGIEDPPAADENRPHRSVSPPPGWAQSGEPPASR